MIKLTKWYYDLVTPKGDVFIGYTVKLQLWNITIPWRASLFWEKNSSILKQGIGRFHSEQDRDQYSLQIPALQLTGCWLHSLQTQPCQLLDETHDNIQWQGLSIHAPAKVRLKQNYLTGKGYIERLDVSFHKTRMPFNKLYWGRFIAADSSASLVWIQFDGPHARSMLFDGTDYYTEALISQQSVHYIAGTLSIVVAKTLLETSIASHVPIILAKLFSGNLASGTERKWLSHGVLTKSDGTRHQGWIIHEEVIW